MSGHANQLFEFMKKKNPPAKKETTAVPALAESEANNADDNVQVSNEGIADKTSEVIKEKQETTTVSGVISAHLPSRYTHGRKCSIPAM